MATAAMLDFEKLSYISDTARDIIFIFGSLCRFSNMEFIKHDVLRVVLDFQYGHLAPENVIDIHRRSTLLNCFVLFSS